MQVQPLSDQKFCALIIKSSAMRLIEKRSSNVEREALNKLVKKQSKNPVDVVLERSAVGTTNLVGTIGYNGSDAQLFITERNAAHKVTPYSFVDKLCRKASVIRERHYDSEKILRLYA